MFGLKHLRVNIKLLMGSGSGFVLNLVLIGLLVVNLVFLCKFWLVWTFLETIQYMFWLSNNLDILVIVTVLVANYAFLNLKK